VRRTPLKPLKRSLSMVITDRLFLGIEVFLNFIGAVAMSGLNGTTVTANSSVLLVIVQGKV
jgi:hypothetical protein